MHRRVITAVVFLSLIGAATGSTAATARSQARHTIAPRTLAHRSVADLLPHVASGHRPGPAILYRKPAVAP